MGKKICVSSAVQEEMVRLRQKCGTKLSIPNVEQLGISRSITICFQNCRSIQKHIEDIRKDRYITKADILGLCETRVLQNKHLYNFSTIIIIHDRTQETVVSCKKHT